MVDIQKGIEQLTLHTTENTTGSLKPRRLLPFPRDPDFIHRPTIKKWMQEQYNKPVRRIALVSIGSFGYLAPISEVLLRLQTNYTAGNHS